MKPTEKHVGGHSPKFQCAEEMVCLGLNEQQIQNSGKSLVFKSALPTHRVLSVLGLNELISNIAPGSLRDRRAGGSKVCLGDVQGESRSLLGLVARVALSLVR